MRVEHFGLSFKHTLNSSNTASKTFTTIYHWCLVKLNVIQHGSMALKGKVIYTNILHRLYYIYISMITVREREREREREKDNSTVSHWHSNRSTTIIKRWINVDEVQNSRSPYSITINIKVIHDIHTKIDQFFSPWDWNDDVIHTYMKGHPPFLG